MHIDVTEAVRDNNTDQLARDTQKNRLLPYGIHSM